MNEIKQTNKTKTIAATFNPSVLSTRILYLIISNQYATSKITKKNMNQKTNMNTKQT